MENNTFFNQLTHQQYISIETFRKSGVGVKTPVWFVQDGDTIFVRTDATSGKVKRIHHHSLVNIAPCKMDGAVLGDWHAATAREVKGSEANRKVDRMLDKKYGLMKKLFALAAIFQRSQYTVLEIKMRE